MTYYWATIGYHGYPFSLAALKEEDGDTQPIGFVVTLLTDTYQDGYSMFIISLII